MALHPELQWLSESKFIRATHGVITNARAGSPGCYGARRIGRSPRPGRNGAPEGKLFTAEEKQLDIFQRPRRTRRSKSTPITREDVFGAITEEDMRGFTYTEHPDNVALALRVCRRALGIAREVALRGMWKANPDRPGAMTEHELLFFGRNIISLNGFAANDRGIHPKKSGPCPSIGIPRRGRRIALFSTVAPIGPSVPCNWGRDCVRWPPPDRIVLMGTGTYLFARGRGYPAGMDPAKFIFAEGPPGG